MGAHARLVNHEGNAMSFRIIGDRIEYEFQLFARIVAPECSTLRFYAEEEIEICDSARLERENPMRRDNFEAESTKEIDALQSKIDDLENEYKKLRAILEEIDDGDTCLDLIAKAEADAEKWREIAKTNRLAYLTSVQRKRRKPL
jgi:ketol-acid reductoisomerase